MTTDPLPLASPEQIAQHQRRLSWMPWLYFRLKAKQRQWAEPWQADIRARLMALETIELVLRVLMGGVFPGLLVVLPPLLEVLLWPAPKAS